MQLTLVVIGKDEASLEHFDRANIGDAELVLVANTKGEPISTIANRHLVNSRAVFGLCHNNTWFGPGSLEVFTRIALAGKVCGIVGRDINGEYCWCHSSPGRVSTLDGCSIFLPVRCQLRFDDVLFDGFHCHVEDMCLQAQTRGMEIIVPLADASHRDTGRTPDENAAWQRDYWRYRVLLENKWQGIKFHTT